MLTTQGKYRIIAKTFHGLENVLAAEINHLGAEDVEIHNRAVTFYGNKELIYKSNLCLRTALRLLIPIKEFEVNNEKELYDKTSEINWSDYIANMDTIAIDSVVGSNLFRHSKYVALKVKDSIVDQFRNKTGKRPSVDVINPVLRINVHINQNQCTISLDSSGDSLHKRGYRHESHKAPLNEVLAAGLILLSGWEKDCTFIDPMCGSGTIPIEAAMLAYNMPPGILRKFFGFMRWRDYDHKLWIKVREASINNVRSHKYKIIGSDISRRAIEIAKSNIEIAGFSGKIKLVNKSFEEFSSLGGDGIIIMNPPYGERIQTDDIETFYEKIGDQLKQAYNGYDVWIFSSNKQALKRVGLKTSGKITLFNGPLETKFHKFEIYKGSKKGSD